jgi:hypothetical protein
MGTRANRLRVWWLEFEEEKRRGVLNVRRFRKNMSLNSSENAGLQEEKLLKKATGCFALRSM